MTQVFPETLTIKMKFSECCYDGCHTPIGMEESLYDAYLNHHDWFYCPRGHRQCFSGESDVEKLKRTIAERDKAITNLTKREEWARQGRDLALHDAKVQRSHAKAAVTISRKLRQRIKAGTCPCCDEKFDNVEQHMKKEHPRYR